MDAIGDSISLILMLEDERSLLALIVKNVCILKLRDVDNPAVNISADPESYRLHNVMLKQTTFPHIVSIDYSPVTNVAGEDCDDW